MPRSLLENQAFRLQFAGHDTFPLRYGWLKKAVDAVGEVEGRGGDTNAVFTSDSAIAAFGVGRNMVTAMRHWALASGVLEMKGGDVRRGGRLVVSEIGKMVFGRLGDPYMEDPGTLWLIHWRLASRPGRATTWYWAFNEQNEPDFSRDLLRTHLSRRCAELREAKLLRESRISDSTLKRDIECFVRTYAPTGPGGRGPVDEHLESPLCELALLQPLDQGRFRMRRGPKPSLPDEVFLFALCEFWVDLHPGRASFSVEALTHEPGSPGRVFLLDEESVADRLAAIADLTQGALRWDEASGIRQVLAHNIAAASPQPRLRERYERLQKVAA
ncbi:MAG TPA: DUF4007 family protein [Azospirillaceae bacterium]|nr:DUF4007 family protein [Azospirillaceae bacterium]